MQAQPPRRYPEFKKPIKDMPITFGKYAALNLTWGEVERDYIEYLLNLERQKVEAYEDELQRRDLVEEAEVPMAMRLIQAGRNALAQVYHPDKGGSEAQMRELNAAYEAVKELISMQTNP